MRYAILGLMALMLSGCTNYSPWLYGYVEEVRINDRRVAWGVWEKKQQEEIQQVALVLTLDCKGQMVVTRGGSAWAMYKKGDRVKVRRVRPAGNPDWWDLMAVPTCGEEP